MDEIRDTVRSDFESILALNDAEVRQTSEMDRSRLAELVHLSTYCKVATVEGQVAAFLIVLRDGLRYDNDNYRWFSSRVQRFLYVDRIVVGSQFSGRGLGRALYSALFEFARSQGVGTVVCEYNLIPPNPASRAFHNRFGFKELGSQWLANGTKQVSLQAAQT